MLPILREGKVVMSRKVGLVYYIVLLWILLTVGIVLSPGKVVVSLEGEEIYHYTYKSNVEEILEEAGIDLRQEDKITPAREEGIGKDRLIIIEKAVPLFIEVDGTRELVYTTKKTVMDIIYDLDMNLGPYILVSPSWKEEVSPLEIIEINIVKYEKEVVTEVIPYIQEIRYDSSLIRGTTRVEEEGFDGVMEKIYQKVLVKGEEEGRELLEANILEEPVNRLVVKGTAAPPRVTSAGRSGFRIGDTFTGIASWYGGNGDGFHGNRTASGEIFNSNELTAAHRYLPFGTVVEVENMRNGKKVEVRINDRGPFIGGRIIDLSKAAAEAIGMRSSGIANVKVRIIKI